MNPKEKYELLNLAQHYFDSKNYAFSEKILLKIIEKEPFNSKANELLAYIYGNKGEKDQSFELLKLACRQKDCSPEAYYYLGIAQLSRKHYVDAIQSLTNSINLAGEFFEATHELATAYAHIKDFTKSLYYYERCLSFQKNSYELYFNIGRVFDELKRYDDALINYEKAIKLKPHYTEAWINKASCLKNQKKHIHSAQAYIKAFQLASTDNFYLGHAQHQMSLGCDWSNFDQITSKIFDQIANGQKSAEPFGFQGIGTSENLIQECAKIFSSAKFPKREDLSKNIYYKHKKIKLGFLSGEFRTQATTILLIRIWELINKSKFEIYAFDSGANDYSDYRARIEKSFNKIFDISKLSDSEASKLIVSEEIDILIDLNGFFGLSRQGILSMKPAPIQVNYLGFPGTIGSSYIDYIIADKVVIPEKSKPYYSEKIAYLPNCYQPNDNLRAIEDIKFSKSDLGLPENKFIYACFNNPYKINPNTFNIWARILNRVPNSILWLLSSSPETKNNLLKEAASRGIENNRIFFCDHLPPSKHLARQLCADLFLDTLPYNAHTTCSDALWAGLPVLTLEGTTFPGRVSSSLLKAIELPELITYSEIEYESMAVMLATDSNKLSYLKKKLDANKLVTPLFNSELYTKNIEVIFESMYIRHSNNLPPESIEIC